MANDHDNESARHQRTVLGASGAASAGPPATPADAFGSGVADTYADPGPRKVTGPPEARPPVSRPPVSRPPVAAPPPAAPPLSPQTGPGTSLEALAGSPSHTAPEIGAGHLDGLPDLPETNPEKWIGKVLSERYRIIKMLGQGGMGVVFLAEHVVIEKRVALKVLNEELSHSRDVISRFIGEAKAASRIGQENIIDITDFGTTPEGGVFFVMEHLDGLDLSERLKEAGKFTWEQTRDVAVQICRGLAAAHSKGIIHRDLKPENVFLINHAGRSDFVKILDFGIAKFTGLEGGEPKKTKTGMIFGTPDYMSPEQAEGRKADHRVDIYALGVILYQLVTGELPFVAETFMGVLHQHMAKEPRPPKELDASIPGDFQAVILRAMAKDPAARFQSMNEFSEALEACTGEDLGAAPSEAPAEVIALTPAEARPASIPPLKPQSDVATGRVAALAEAQPALPTRESAVGAAPSPAAAEPPAARKKSPVPFILLFLALAVGVGVGAFFLLRGKPADKGTEGSAQADGPGAMSVMTTPPPAPKPDAAPAVPEMRPAPMPVLVTPKTVKLSLVTIPRGAEVRLDGKVLGKTPLKKHAIPYSAEERVLTIQKRRYKTVEIRFTPDANQSWERRLVRGGGVTRVSGMRSMRPEPRPVDMRPVIIRARPMPPPMRGGLKDLKDPFAMSPRGM